MLREFSSIVKMALQIWQILAKPQRRALFIALLIMFATGVLTSVPPVVLGRLVDDILRANTVSLPGAAKYVAAILVAILVREALQVLRKYLIENASTQLGKNTTVEITGRLLRLDLKFFGPEMKVGSLHGRVHRSIEGLVKMIKLCFLDFFPAGVTAVCAIVVVAAKNPILAITMGLVVPVGLLIVLRQLSTQKGIRIDLLRAKEEMDGRAVELLGGIEYVRAANTEDLETAKLEKAAEYLRGKEIQHHVWMALYDSLKYLNEGAFMIIVLCLSIYLASRGIISAGGILTYSLLFANIVNPLREVHRILDEAHESSLRVADLLELREKPMDESYKECAIQPARAQTRKSEPHIEIRDLHFRYPFAKANGEAVNGVSLTITEGEKIGVAGPSGSGKSTWIKILLRLFHPTSGEIVVNGRPLRNLSRAQIAAEFAYVSQSPFLVSGTIEDNIRYGCKEVSREQIIEAATRASIHDEIVAMSDGYHTRVAERGLNLSGGQRQRIAIARIFLKDPRVLLLDEATAALDNANERLVQNALAEAMAGRTVITIAHRLSTLRGADKILVFRKGSIVEQGTYSELLDYDGVFASLDEAARLQA